MGKVPGRYEDGMRRRQRARVGCALAHRGSITKRESVLPVPFPRFQDRCYNGNSWPCGPASTLQKNNTDNHEMSADRKRPRLTIASLALSVSLLAGCATGTNPEDPFESFNRGVYSFNEGVDKVLLKPAAEVYQAALPQFIRTSISNFFG